MTQSKLGLNYLFQGFHLICQPGMKRFVAIPLAINMSLFVGLFFVARHFIHVFNLWFVNHLPAWLHWLSGILWVVFIFCFLLVMVYTFVMFANLIAAPFNSFLAEEIEFYLTGNKIKSRSMYENIKDVPRIVGRQLAILGYYLPRALLILILFIIPVVHILAAVLWILFNAWFLAFTYLDYPTDNHQIPLQAVKIWMQNKRLVTLGFGLTVLVANMIPILNLFAMPAAVAGATKFWLEESQ